MSLIDPTPASHPPHRGRILAMALLLGAAPWVWGQTQPSAPAPAAPTAPSSSQKELDQPLVLDDGKPTQGNPVPEPSGWRVLGSTLLMVGLAGGGLWAFRKYALKRLPGSGGKRLKVDETLALGERRYLSLVQADGERFLIGLTPQSITLIARLDPLQEEDFQQAVQQHLEVTRPMPVKDMEALIKGERP